MTAEDSSATPKTGFSLGGMLAGIALFFLQILLPVLVGGGMAYAVATFFKIWGLNRILVLVIFAVLLFIFSIFIALIVGTIAIRDRSQRGYQLRLVVMVLGGLVIPIGLFAAANILSIAPGESYMGRLINLNAATAEVTAPVGSLASVIMASKDPYTRVAGIKAIGSDHSPESLQQLLVILNGDPALLAYPAVSAALSKELAAYGADARPGLLAAFQKRAHASPAATPLPANLYDRYFNPAIAALQADVSAQPLDDQARFNRLQQVTALGAKIQADVSDLPASLVPSGDPVLDLVCDAFLQMNLASDADVYAFARSSAGDASLPESTRGKALLLLAKLGTKDDLPGLSSYLSSPSERIKAAAFDAIASLNQKLAGPSKMK